MNDDYYNYYRARMYMDVMLGWGPAATIYHRCLKSKQSLINLQLLGLSWLANACRLSRLTL